MSTFSVMIFYACLFVGEKMKKEFDGGIGKAFFFEFDCDVQNVCGSEGIFGFDSFFLSPFVCAEASVLKKAFILPHALKEKLKCFSSNKKNTKLYNITA